MWLNQYENENNWQAHHRHTAPAIARQFPDLDVLFVGAGTTGTLMGCARWFREHRPSVRIVAVDVVGSVSFGGPSSTRMIPGLGMGVRPPLLDESYVDEDAYCAHAASDHFERYAVQDGIPRLESRERQMLVTWDV